VGRVSRLIHNYICMTGQWEGSSIEARSSDFALILRVTLPPPNFGPYQSAYHEGYSTETALISTLDNIFSSIDNGKACLSVCLDLSAAFDTVDHQLHLSRLSKSFSVCRIALNWLASYLGDHNQQVGIITARFEPTFCTAGVPQGSVLGPLLFTIFTSPINNIAKHFGIQLQQMIPNSIFLCHTLISLVK